MRKIVLLGDSIARGVVRDNRSAKYCVSCASFAKNCERLMNVQMDNQARMGSTVVHGLVAAQRFTSKITEADEVWLLFGGNDSNMNLTNIDTLPEPVSYQPTVTLQEFQQKYTELIQQVQNLGANVILLSLPPFALRKFLGNVRQSIHTPMGKCKWQQFVHNQPEMLANWHEMYNLSVFKLAHKHHVPIIDITTPFLKKGDCESYFCDDGIHPNIQGHLLITDAIIKNRPELVSFKQILLNHYQQKSTEITN
ncbi:MAG: SGNH/GDSL hydrolase family protein [Alphaproteobacteria bacterium]|nr:SGNH/GDSL hydrolase family protein [Alphaproteobacteria bacterium]